MTDVVSDSDTFYQTLELSLDEPVGCLSMSPENRDIVLGARKGLFVIDLNHPYEPPRFLAHSATWDVADIQWSPHPERRHWVASTSSQKALVWNLDLPYHSQAPSYSHSNSFLGATLYPLRGVQSPIQFVLEAHTRAICDINWSVFNVDVIATCGIDSWTYAFDLRAGGSKAVQGFCAWTSPATQVKWNRQDPHLLATSHDCRALIWDTRNSAVPLVEIQAHDEKIYGVDWSRRSPENLVTCSLDKTVKFWSINSPEAPSDTILTRSPVRRARHLPFGRGVMTLPQRSDHVLRMWSRDCLIQPVATFAGHRDTVREFVWRTRGGDNPGYDDRQFQLVTWGNDRKLRLWPVNSDVMDKVGFKTGSPIDVRVTRKATSTGRSFRHSNLNLCFVPSPPSMSASPFRLGKMSQSSSASSSVVPRPTPLQPASPRNRAITMSEGVRKDRLHQTNQLSARRLVLRNPGFMTRQTITSSSNLPNNRLTWMEGVRLYRPASNLDTPASHETNETAPLNHTRSLSRDRQSTRPSSRQPPNQLDGPRSLGVELTAAQRNFPRVTFEKLDVQARTCSIGLYGPWAARGGMAFLRASFSFPRSYPELKPPSIEIGRSSDIGTRTRAFLLKSARELMQDHIKSPKSSGTGGGGALEPCLRFLLGDRSALKSEKADRFVDSDEEIRDAEGGIRPHIIENNVSLPIPRQAGVLFTPTGRLVTFYCGEFRVTHTPQTSTIPSKRNYKFEAFGTLALSPINRVMGIGSDSESDDALRLPTSRRDQLLLNDPHFSSPDIPSRELSTIVMIHTIGILKPCAIPKLESFDPLIIAESALTLTASQDQVRVRSWTTIDLFLKTLNEFPDLPINHSYAAFFLETLKYLRQVQDLETLGYIACVIELIHRSRKSLLKIQRQPSADIYPATDYFNSRSVDPLRKPTSSETLQTPDIPPVAESAQSPFKGSWSSFFISLTHSSSTTHPTLITKGSNTPQACNTTTPSPDRAVAMLKQQLAGSNTLENRRDSKLRPDLLTEGSAKNVSFLTQSSKAEGSVGSRSSLPRKRRIRVKDHSTCPEPSTGTSSCILDNEELWNELEGYKYILCDLLMRREKYLESTMVQKMLRIKTDENPSDQFFFARDRMLSGLDSQSGLELGRMCWRCGEFLLQKVTRCEQCQAVPGLAQCSICHRPVTGLSRGCGECLHGGHVKCMSEWWKMAPTCPIGCGCLCAS